MSFRVSLPGVSLEVYAQSFDVGVGYQRVDYHHRIDEVRGVFELGYFVEKHCTALLRHECGLRRVVERYGVVVDRGVDAFLLVMEIERGGLLRRPERQVDLRYGASAIAQQGVVGRAHATYFHVGKRYHVAGFGSVKFGQRHAALIFGAPRRIASGSDANHQQCRYGDQYFPHFTI